MRKNLLIVLAIMLTFVLKHQAQGVIPVTYYPFNGNTKDAIDASNSSSAVGATLTTDRFGVANRAYQFTGTTTGGGAPTSYILANAAVFKTSNWTISAWVKPDEVNRPKGCIVFNGFANSTGGAMNCNGFEMDLTMDQISGTHLSVCNPTNFTGGSTVVASQWYFFTMVNDGGTTTLYINGVAAPNTSTDPIALPNNNSTMVIGATNTGNPFKGAIDEVKLYDVALTPTQVINEFSTPDNELKLPISVLSGGNGGDCSMTNPDNTNGSRATGIGCGGGGAGQYGGSGGNGLLGGGGGGAAGNNVVKKGGSGGNGFVVIVMADATGTITDKKLFVGGSSYTIPAGVTQAKVFDVGCGGGGAGARNLAAVAGGGGGAGGVAYKKYAIAPGDVMTYSIGEGGGSTSSGTIPNGFQGSATTATINGQTITGNGGQGGRYNSGIDATGGTFSGGDGGVTGGVGRGVMGDVGGGAGGGIGVAGGYNYTSPCNGGIGGKSGDLDILFGVFANTATAIDNKPEQKPGSGNSLTFTGSGSRYVQLPNSLINDFSLEFWMNTSTPGLTGTHAFECTALFYADIANINANDFTIGLNGNNISFTTGDAGTDNTITGTRSVVDGQWHHVAITRNRTTGVKKIFIDGIEAAMGTGSTDRVDGPLEIIVGTRTGGSNDYAGQIDEIKMWTLALTEAQIRERMCRKITPTDALYSNLVSYYNIDETSGDIINAYASSYTRPLLNGLSRNTSGAPIGNASAFDYTNATKTATIAHASTESFAVTSTSGNPDGLHVYRVDEKPNTANGITGVGDNDRYFGVFQVGGTTPQYSAVYNYTGNPYIQPIVEPTLGMYKRDNNAGTVWANSSATLNTSAKTLTVTGQSTEYMLGSTNIPLPLQLISFTGNKQNNNAVLQWKTTNEMNVMQYDIQRSYDGITFTTIANVPAGRNDYTYTDTDIFINKQTVYYRLKSVELGNRITQSMVIRLKKVVDNKINVFPNPTTDKVVITGLKNMGVIRITNAAGKVVYQQKVLAQTTTVDVSQLSAGLYNIIYEN